MKQEIWSNERCKKFFKGIQNLELIDPDNWTFGENEWGVFGLGMVNCSGLILFSRTPYSEEDFKLACNGYEDCEVAVCSEWESILRERIDQLLLEEAEDIIARCECLEKTYVYVNHGVWVSNLPALIRECPEEEKLKELLENNDCLACLHTNDGILKEATPELVLEALSIREVWL